MIRCPPERHFSPTVGRSTGTLGGPWSGGATVRHAAPTEPDAPDEGSQVPEQDHNRTRTIRSTILPALLMGVVLLLAGCAFEFSVGGEDLSLSEVVASSAIDGEGVATAATSSFDIDTPVIYVTSRVDGADDGARVEVVWSHETEGVFAEVPIDLLEGSSRPYSEVTRPDAGWPVGSYEVDVVVTNPDDERVSRQVTFQVVAPVDDVDVAVDQQAEPAPEQEPADDQGDPAADAPDADDAPQAESVPDAEGPGFDRPDGLPVEFPLPGVDGMAFAVPDEEGLFALSLQMSLDDATAFFDEAPGVSGWSTIMREDADPDIEGVLYLLQGHDQTVIVVIGPDEDGPGQTLVAVQLDPQL